MSLIIRKCIYGLLSFIDRVFGREEFPIAIYCYHSVASDNWRFGVAKKTFIEQMEYLLSIRQPITVVDLEAHISGEKVIDKPSFLICFDDGYEDILTVRKYLFSKGIKPVLFVLSDTKNVDIDELGTERAFLSVEEIKSLQEEGWSIGSHGATHRDFWELSDEQVSMEILFSRENLEKTLGFPVLYFAYPRGRYNERVLGMVERSGYRMAFSMDDGRIDQDTQQFILPRIGVDRTHTFREFQQIASPANITFRKVVKVYFSKFITL